MTGAHTPTPWRVAKRAQRRVTGEHGVVICNAVLRNQGGPKAKTCLKSEHEAEANAELIVRAVNSHEELVAALDRARIAIDDWLNTYADDLCEPARVAEAAARIGQFGTLAYIADVQQQVGAALAKARGETL